MDFYNKEKDFTDSLDKYGVLISKICYYFSSDSEEFKDLRQEVIYNIWKGWDDFRNDSKLSTWIYRVSFNTCISFHRKGKKTKSFLPLEEIIDLPDSPGSSLLERYNIMHTLISKLGLKDRAIILMWLDEKSYDEIAELMGMNRNTLAVRLKRIKEKLVKMNKNL